MRFSKLRLAAAIIGAMGLLTSIGVWAGASAAPSVTRGPGVRQAATIRVAANTMTYIGNDGTPLGVLLLKVGHMALVGQCNYGRNDPSQPYGMNMKFISEAVGGPVELVAPGAPGEAPSLTYLSPGGSMDPGSGVYGNPTDHTADVVVVFGPAEDASGIGTFAVMDAKGPTFSGTWADLGDYNHQSCQFTVQVAG